MQLLDKNIEVPLQAFMYAYCICSGFNLSTGDLGDLPDLYAQSVRAEGIHIRLLL